MILEFGIGNGIIDPEDPDAAYSVFTQAGTLTISSGSTPADLTAFNNGNEDFNNNDVVMVAPAGSSPPSAVRTGEYFGHHQLARPDRNFLVAVRERDVLRALPLDRDRPERCRYVGRKCRRQPAVCLFYRHERDQRHYLSLLGQGGK